MAYSRATRARARQLYVDGGLSFRAIAEQLDVGKTTLLRWASKGEWDRQREEQDRLERESRKLLLEMLGAAMDSKDPQQVYAATQIAAMAGVELGPRDEAGPTPKQCAVLLLDVLGKHHAVGPVVRGHRNEVIRLFLQEVDRMESPASPAVRR